MTENKVIYILYNLLKAVNFVHSANIIHRDLKPNNFLIDKDCKILLCDFGLARINPPISKEEKNLKELNKNLYKKVLAAKNDSDRVYR